MEDDILHKLLESRLIAIARGIPNSHIEAAVRPFCKEESDAWKYHFLGKGK